MRGQQTFGIERGCLPDDEPVASRVTSNSSQARPGSFISAPDADGDRAPWLPHARSPRCRQREENPDHGGRGEVRRRRRACPATREPATTSPRSTSLSCRRSGGWEQKHVPAKRSRGSSGNRSSDAVHRVESCRDCITIAARPNLKLCKSHLIFHNRGVADTVDQLAATRT